MSEEREDLARLPNSRVIDLVRGHRLVHVQVRVVLGIVEESESGEDQRGLFAVAERHVERLIEGGRVLVGFQDVQRRAEPRQAELGADRVPVSEVYASEPQGTLKTKIHIPDTIKVHKVVGILEVKPLLNRE